MDIKKIKVVLAGRGVYIEGDAKRPSKVVVTGNNADVQADLRAAGFEVAPVVGSNVLRVSE